MPYGFKQEGIAVGRTFAALKGYKVDGNKEMMAIGLMNIVGSSTSCYVTTGSVRIRTLPSLLFLYTYVALTAFLILLLVLNQEFLTGFGIFFRCFLSVGGESQCRSKNSCL